MKQTAVMTVLIFVKASEPGLLAIADGREKSLVPVFGVMKIIDYYIAPFFYSGVNGISVLLEKDMRGVKAHLVYSYPSSRVRILDESDVCGALFKILKTGKTESFILLRADGIVLTDWEELTGRLRGLPAGNYELLTKKKVPIGFFIQNTGLGSISGIGATDFSPGISGIDGIWEELAGRLRQSVRKISCKAEYYSLRTVVDYYDVHFRLLQDMTDYTQVRSSLPGNEVKDENISCIGRGGVVKNSYLSHSCNIDGYIDHSILFQNVKVGKRASVINSIIMENNYIGDGASVLNSIVCDNAELFSKVSPNIGERARIGEDDSTGSNTLSPESIHEGITLIGRNVEIPREYKISRNCFVASNVDKASLKGRKRIKAGDSVLVH